MNKRISIIILCVLLLGCPLSVYADVLDYEEVMDLYRQEGNVLQTFETDDGAGGTVRVIARDDILYLASKDTAIYSAPGESGTEICRVLLGTALNRVGVCDNGWSKVSCENEGARVIGYVKNEVLSDREMLQAFTDTVKVKQDSDILDFPGRKDGEVVGEVLEMDEIVRTGTINDIWSRILYLDADGTKQVGYIPTASLEGQETEEEKGSEEIDEKLEAGLIHKSSSTGLFAQAEEEQEATVTQENGVQVGTPVAASSDASLVSLGTFRITHYCPCSICCGPWADGITSTGITAVTNHTIAVDPTQIPYGSKVVINGQVYVAEDCGGAIKKNCIDIYVATHAEGEAKGVYYTEVYLLQ